MIQEVVICPYCRRSLPQPLQTGLSYACPCGSRFAAFQQDDLEDGLVRLVNELFTESSQPLVELLESCQVTVFRGYQTEEAGAGGDEMSEFVREVVFQPAPREAIDLVWVVRHDAAVQVTRFDQNKN
ncbi:MAG: hypothetical protein JRC92_05790 [Deltaproteobacteria bacterium]|nr:hypothetical protein [Deltaproteobacteria bacterium]